MNTPVKDTYQVAVKVFLEHEGKFLVLKDMYDDGWDLPGGRLTEDEFATPLEDVVARKMGEELGTACTYTLGAPVVHFRHERIEGNTGERVRIFAVGYRAEYTGGEIMLGEYLRAYEWVDMHSFNPKEYFTGGWLVGVEEYLASRR